MRVIPAIDLRAGACVQLVGGAYADERVRLPDPVAVARRWRAAGFRELHIVDLDAATGRGDNAHAVARLLAEGMPAQVGGGLRDEAAVARVLALGAARAVVGTQALAEPAWLAHVAARWPDRLVVAADVRDGAVLVRGWQEALALSLAEALAALTALPLAGVLVTAVHCEGLLAGPDLALLAEVRRLTRHTLITSGGITTMQDLEAVAATGADAAVLGMALYTGALDPTLAAAASR